jgi:hypothetical protein
MSTYFDAFYQISFPLLYSQYLGEPAGWRLGLFAIRRIVKKYWILGIWEVLFK